MTRARAAVLLAAVAGLCLVVSATRWVDLSAAGVLPALQALSPWAAGLALIAGPAALLADHRSGPARVVGVLVALDLVLLAALPPSPAPVADPVEGGAELVVTSANTGLGRADVDTLLREADARGTDVLVLLEADRWFVERLDRAGADELYPHRVVSPDDAPSATAVLSRVPFEEVASRPLGFASWDLRLDVDGVPLRLYAVHPAPPLPGLHDQWRADLDDIDTWTGRTGGPVVVAGDFNASAAHPGFRELCQGEGALQECGSVFRRPTWTPVPGLPPILPLDHVLVRGVSVAGSGGFVLEGSDHRAVWRRVVVR